jgi:hypothetical protein
MQYALGMNRHSVSSTNITAVGWEPGDEDIKVHSEKLGTLEVEFGDGSIYQFGQALSGCLESFVNFQLSADLVPGG